MNLRETNMIRASLLLAAIGLTGFFWSRGAEAPSPAPEPSASPVVAESDPAVAEVEPPRRVEAEVQLPAHASISRTSWENDAKLVQRRLIEAVLSGNEAAIERAQAEARALADRSAASGAR